MSRVFSPTLLAVVIIAASNGGCGGANGPQELGRPGGDSATVEPARDAVVIQATPASEAPPMNMDEDISAAVALPPQPGAAVSGPRPMPTPVGGADGVRTPVRVSVTPSGAPASGGGATSAPTLRPAAPTSASPTPPEPEPVDEGYDMELDSAAGSADVEEAEAPASYSRAERRSSRRDRRRARRREGRRSRRPAPAAEAAPSAPVMTDDSIPGSYVIQQPVQVQRILTAATVADVDRRGNYLSYLSRHPGEAAMLQLDMSRRIRFRVVDGSNRPVHDAALTIVDGNLRVTGRTHADGYWDFFPSLSSPQISTQPTVYIQHGGNTSQATIPVPPAGDGRDIFIRLPQAISTTPSVLDLAFVIDVTGSMSDELRYVNEEVVGIVARVREAVPNVQVRVAATFYRDRGDAVPIEQIPFSTNVQGFVAQMRYVQASGGGDYPEDVNTGLAAALTTLQWSTGPAVRVLCVIADAPPQRYADFPYTYHHAMVDASTRGIRILPVAASGADRIVEFLFRAMGAFTSTPYVYLTNDSGVGGHHMEADTDRVAVEMFSDLLTRMLIADLQGVGMHEAIEDSPVLAPLQ